VISNRYAKCQVHHLFFPENFVSRHSFPRGQSIPRQTARHRELRTSSFPFAVPIALMKKAFLAVDEEGVVNSSYRALRRPIVRCFVQTRARSGGGVKGNRAK